MGIKGDASRQRKLQRSFETEKYCVFYANKIEAIVKELQNVNYDPLGIRAKDNNWDKYFKPKYQVAQALESYILHPDVRDKLVEAIEYLI